MSMIINKETKDIEVQSHREQFENWKDDNWVVVLPELESTIMEHAPYCDIVIQPTEIEVETEVLKEVEVERIIETETGIETQIVLEVRPVLEKQTIVKDVAVSVIPTIKPEPSQESEATFQETIVQALVEQDYRISLMELGVK